MGSNNENWDVIIVGAGPSGLGVGAQLAHAGKKVLVLEKEKGFGGRASTSSHAGMTFDNGPHAPMMAGDLEKIFDRIGKPAPVMGTQLKKTEVWHEGAWADLKDLYPHGAMKELIRELLATPHEETSTEELKDCPPQPGLDSGSAMPSRFVARTRGPRSVPQRWISVNDHSRL